MTEKQVMDFVSYMEDTGRSYTNEQGFCFFLKLKDESLQKIKENPLILINPEFLKDMLVQDGKNIHIIGAYGKGIFTIRKAVKEIAKVEHAESISWVNQKMTRFIERRVL